MNLLGTASGIDEVFKPMCHLNERGKSNVYGLVIHLKTAQGPAIIASPHKSLFEPSLTTKKVLKLSQWNRNPNNSLRSS